MGIIAKNFVTRALPFPMIGGANRMSYAPGAQTAQTKTSYLRYYSEISWLRAAVSTIAQAVAQSNWRLYKKTKDGNREEITGTHPLKDLLNRPNPFQSGHEFLELHQTFSELLGEAYQIKQMNRGLKELWLAPPQYMTVIPDTVNYISGYKFEREGTIRNFKPEEVIAFIEANPLEPLVGSGRAQGAGIEIESQSFMGQYIRNFFYWDASTGTVITYPIEANITVEELDRLAQQWDAGHRSYGRAYRTAVLTQGATISSTAPGQKDMDFVNLSKYTRDSILGVFGLSYAIVGGTESINRANAEAQLLNFARWVLLPRLIKIREKWNMFLVPDYGDDLELDFDNPVPEDTAIQATIIDGHVTTGLLSLEEGRQLLDMGDIVEDHHFIIPINYQIMTGQQILGGFQTTPLALPLRSKSIYQTEQAKTAYWNAYIKRTEAYEPKAIYALKVMWREQENEALKSLETTIDRNHKLLDIEKVKKSYGDAMIPVMTQVLTDFMEQGQNLVSPKVPHKAWPNKAILPQTALDWLKTRIGWAATQVGGETEAQLAQALINGFNNGESMDQIARRIIEVFDGFTTIRAERIARTEIMMASNQGAKEGYRSVGVEKMEWMTARDDRTCPICQPMDGEIFAIDDFPMPPSSTHPSCRCVGLPVIR